MSDRTNTRTGVRSWAGRREGTPLQCRVQFTKPHLGQTLQALLQSLVQHTWFPKNPKAAAEQRLCPTTPVPFIHSVPAPRFPHTCFQIQVLQPCPPRSDFMQPPFCTGSRGTICIMICEPQDPRTIQYTGRWTELKMREANL